MLNGARPLMKVALHYQKTKIMQTKQTIAVIGATGNMGSAISKSLSKGNYRLLLGAAHQEKLETLVNEIRVVRQ